MPAKLQVKDVYSYLGRTEAGNLSDGAIAIVLA